MDKNISAAAAEPAPQRAAFYAWYTQQDGKYTVIYANFQGADPNSSDVEINVRRNCFWPRKTGVNCITVSGFTMRQAATTWAPPAAFQDGLIGPNLSRGWIIEDCEISDSKCVGISPGKYLQPNNENKWTLQRFKQGTQTERDAICQAQYEGWNKETIYNMQLLYSIRAFFCCIQIARYSFGETDLHSRNFRMK